jgi:16S rRNA (uracil1498-N3)-methyltransferase
LPHRFFVSSSNIHGSRIILDDEADLRHIISVLRLGAGDEIALFDEKGDEHLALIDKVRKQRIEALVVGALRSEVESPLSVTLFQGLPKGDKMDFAVRSATQLGVGAIVPLLTERTVPRLAEGKVGDRLGHWARVAREATAQSGRSLIPAVERPMMLSEAFKKSSECDLSLLFWEGVGARHDPPAWHASPLRDVLAKYDSARKVSLFIGPEGGFSTSEVEEARGYGIIAVSLGPRILRTEVAGVVALSIVMYELGDVGHK